ncbi:tetratricopeptide repeat protein [Brucella sp. BE17]|uniref:tetratricopeptide repeat protein n=1 Tax=Brucella sp. BE17 TaxID=3142977 RepID=UPI0031BA60CF
MGNPVRMRNVFAHLIFALVIALGIAVTAPDAAMADTAAPQSENAQPPAKPITEPQSREERLDTLFSELRRTRDEAKAVRISSQINTLWSQSGSATVDLLMQWANAALIEQRYPSAIDFLNEAIALDPDYAEAWNRRATVYFLQKDYAHAMYDINRTLELEPRHYGALSGMAGILRARGFKEQSLKAYEQALTIYPMMREAQKSLLELTDELTDIRT